MPAAIVDFIARVDPGKREALDDALERLRAGVQAPSRAPFGRVGTLHFASLVVFEGDDGAPPLLVFENNYDGALDAHVAALLKEAAPELHAVFSCCEQFTAVTAADTPEFTRYLLAHAVRPAAWHIGNVGRSRARVGQESTLRAWITKSVDEHLRTNAPPATPGDAYSLLSETVSGTGTFLWIGQPHARESFLERIVPKVRLYGTIALAAIVLILILPVTILVAIIVVATLRMKELHDRPMDPAESNPDHIRRLTQQEDFRVQNHLASMTVVKPGIFRRTLLRVVLWGANLLARTSTHGSLSGIPSIHFAHWALVDNGRRLLFLSNFDGSWESYLDDFIDKAAKGLTGIWTNTVGFPRTSLLVNAGASDGVAFKAFARAQQAPTAVWYSAYPDLTVQQIDSQSTLREGLANKPGGAALRAWLRNA